MGDKLPYANDGGKWDGVDNETTRFPRITFKGGLKEVSNRCGTHSSIELNSLDRFDCGAPTKTQEELAPD